MEHHHSYNWIIIIIEHLRLGGRGKGCRVFHVRVEYRWSCSDLLLQPRECPKRAESHWTKSINLPHLWTDIHNRRRSRGSHGQKKKQNYYLLFVIYNFRFCLKSTYMFVMYQTTFSTFFFWSLELNRLFCCCTCKTSICKRLLLWLVGLYACEMSYNDM